MDTLKVLKLLVDTLEKAEQVMSFIPYGYRLDALTKGKDLVQLLENISEKGC